MKKRLLLIALAAAFIIAGCSKQEADLQPQQPETEVVPGVGTVKAGEIIIKFKDDQPETKASASLIPELEVYSMTQLFPTDPRYKERHIKEELNLWYIVSFNPETPITKAHNDFTMNDNISVAEYIPVSARKADTYPFDDPGFSSQWHYHNTAQVGGYVKGMDINLLKAWEIETGSESIVVAVVDGGVDYSHPDLADAMWINEAEKNGIYGVDDDNNGYIDDIYGCDLVDRGGNIVADDHGTHVAGTIGAINNNGKAGAGIAGGKNGKGGVRIMTCQMFKGEKQGAGATGIVYAADNGAVICNNSWGFIDPDVVSASTHAAIDYFNKYAGLDARGNQVGAMAGGLTVFAAGNNNMTKSSPSMYEGAFAVASIGPTGAKAASSNYGEWIDITATGGDGQTAPVGYVWSTTPNGGFGGMSGTSMACPHVSGVAALVVSKSGGPGFTGKMLRERLSSSANYDKLYNANISSLKGRLGSGLLDAYAALQEDATPDKVVDVDVEVLANQLLISWNGVATNGSPTYSYEVYYSTEDLSDFVPGNGNVSSVSVVGDIYKVGAPIEVSVPDLEFNTKYYVRVQAVNYFGNGSALSSQVEVVTEQNNAPVINPGSDIDVTLRPFDAVEYSFNIIEPDNHDFTVELLPVTDELSLKVNGNKAIVKIEAYKAEPGNYVATMNVADKYGAVSSVKISYAIRPNTPPEAVGAIANCILSKGEVVKFDLTPYFNDADGEALTYSATVNSKLVADFNINENILTIKGKSFGSVTATITAADAKQTTASFSFDVLLRDKNAAVDVYPNPVQSVLNIRTAENANAEVTVSGLSGGTVYSNSSVMVGPFTPFAIDARGWDAGSYTVVVKYNGKEYKHNIVKL